MNASHTPGPWRWTYRQISDGRGVVTTAAVMLETEPEASGAVTSTILAVRDDWIGWMNRGVSAGDRALIASAPELLQALRECADRLGEMDCGPELDRARAAIAKAEGRAHT